MEYMWMIFGLYLVYYLVLPVGLFFLIYKIWQKRKTIKGATEFGSVGKSAPELKKKVGEMKKLQISLVILLLLFLPLNNVVSHQIQDLSIENEQAPVGGLGGSIEYDQVDRQLGPSYDPDSVISDMDPYLFSLKKSDYELEKGNVSGDLREEFEDRGYELEEEWNLIDEESTWWIVDDNDKEYRIEETEDKLEVYEKLPTYESWFIEDVREAIDLERLTRFPGRLSVYYLDKADIGNLLLITYSYLSPLPITRTFTFLIYEGEASLDQENTIIYPLNPANIDPF